MALTDANKATALSVTELETEFNDNKADVNDTLAALSDANKATALSITDLETEFNDNKADVNDTLIALSDAQSATAGRLSDYEVEVGDEFASVHEEVSAVYDPETGAVAQAVTTVNVNGVRGVIGIQVQGEQAQIIGIANQFAILNPVNDELVTAFAVSDGRVVIPTALIRDLTGANIDVDNLVVRRGQSTNFQAGVRGWRLTTTGGEINFPISFNNVQGAGVLASKDAIVYEELEGPTAGLVLERANSGAAAKSRTDGWTRPGSTRIDGNQIFTGDAYVDTLQVKGDAISATYVANTAGQFQRQFLFGDTADWLTVQELDVESEGSPHDLLFSVRVRTDSDDNDGTASAAPQVRLLRNGNEIFTLTSVQKSSGSNRELWNLPVVIPATINMGSGSHTLTIQVRASIDMAWSGNGLTPRVLLTAGARYIRSLELKR